MGSVHQQRLTDINVSFDFSVQVFPSGRCHPFSLRSTDRQVSYGAGLWEVGFFFCSVLSSAQITLEKLCTGFRESVELQKPTWWNRLAGAELPVGV